MKMLALTVAGILTAMTPGLCRATDSDLYLPVGAQSWTGATEIIWAQEGMPGGRRPHARGADTCGPDAMARPG